MGLGHPLRALVLVAVACGQSTAQEPALADVLARAAAYVDSFERELSAIVSEETYTQRVTNLRPSSASLNAPARPPFQGQTLKSDLLLIRPGDTAGWVHFRDVFEVDGRAVRDRAERLTRLFLEPNDTTDDQIRRIIQESARYNIGDVQRTINVPLLPLVALEGASQSRFRFRRADSPARAGRDRSLPDAPTFTVSTEVWVVGFEEIARPTMIRSPRGDDIPSRGRFWVEPESGRVLMSELITEDRDVRAQINVSYQSEPLLGLYVPVEMREQYTSGSKITTIDGTAKYGRFRKFQEKTDEEIAIPR